MNKFIIFLITSTLASKFSTDIRKYELCADPSILKEVDSKFPKLNSCYQYSSLFFSTIGVPCSSECFDVTVEASKFLYDSCKLSLPDSETSLMNHKERIYSLWSDSDAASTVCKKINKNSACLTDFNRLATQVANGLPLNPKKVCHSCHQQMFQQFKDNPYSIPVVYYQIVHEPEKVLKSLGEVCEWN